MSERFTDNFTAGQANDCWLWRGSIDKDGYGVITDDFRKQARAHRVAYEQLHGPIGIGKQLLHACDTPNCVNPNHLSVGSADDNNKDKARKLRASSKLTADEVREIRRLHADGLTLNQIAERYGVTASGCIWPIVHNKVWRHL